jgi:hypothetical protein
MIHLGMILILQFIVGIGFLLLVLNVRNGWEWGLLGLLFIVIVDHSLIPY